MNPICWMFGHRPERGYSRDDTGYFRISGIAIDGMRVRHAALTAECRRCHVRYMIGKVHLPSEDEKLLEQLLGHLKAIVTAYRLKPDRLLAAAIEKAEKELKIYP